MSFSVRNVTRSGPKCLGYKISSFSSSHCATHSNALLATARTNEYETLARANEAVELLTWKNIAPATAVVRLRIARQRAPSER
eukprot:scaffold59708_cov57-Phaeocystis_antarctica.AAC.2